jgi:hypothetical protein
MGTNNSYINALVGAAVTVVLSFIPFSPLLGGAVAGFLERWNGARIGFISGVFAAIPLFILLAVVGVGISIVPGFGHGLAEGVVVVALLLVLFLVAYVVTLSVVGGVVGVYLGEEFHERRDAGER